jgi:hypothetical protein
MHFTPEGLPSAIPGKEEDIDSATQQAPQPERHSIGDIVKGIKTQWLNGAKIRKVVNIVPFFHCAVVPLCRCAYLFSLYFYKKKLNEN